MELPRLEPIWNRLKDAGLSVLAIESQRETEAALEFIRAEGLSYTLVEDIEGEHTVIADTLQIYGYPTSFLIGRDGRIMFAHVGFDEGDERILEEEIRRLLDS